MKKSFFQVIIEATVILSGLGAIASFINSIVNASSLIDYRFKIVIAILLCLIYFIFSVMVYMGKVPWVAKDGRILKVKKIGRKIEVLFVGSILILFAQSCIDFYKSKHPPRKIIYLKKPVFDPYNSSFKLLIFPWHKECILGDKSYDVGYVLKRRIEELAKQRNINILVRYVDDSIPPFIDSDIALAQMRYHNADQILYGSYSLSECEGGTPDKICFNYQTDDRKWQLKELHANDRYVMSKLPHGLDDIRNGTGQEDIEFVIYWITAMTEMRDEHLSKAIELFSSIKDYQSKASVLFQISNCYHFMNDYEKTKAMLEKVLQLDPSHIEAAVHLSGLFVNEGKTELASRQLEKILIYEPDNPSVLRDLCLFYRSTKDTAKSDVYLQKFLEAVPDEPGSYKDLGAIYRDIRDYTKSKEYYEKAIRVCAKHPHDNAVLGEAYMLTGDSAKAKLYFEQALAIEPGYVSALYNMGILSQREKDHLSAVGYLEKAIKLNPHNYKALMALGKNYTVLEEKQKAQECYDKALKVTPYKWVVGKKEFSAIIHY